MGTRWYSGTKNDLDSHGIKSDVDINGIKSDADTNLLYRMRLSENNF